jgi:hypothetical protein
MENRDVLGWLARVKLAVSGVPCSSPTFVAVLRYLGPFLRWRLCGG